MTGSATAALLRTESRPRTGKRSAGRKTAAARVVRSPRVPVLRLGSCVVRHLAAASVSPWVSYPANARWPPYHLDEVAVVPFALEPSVGLDRAVGAPRAYHDVTLAVLRGVPGLQD